MLISDHKATEHSLLLEGMHLFWHQIYIFKGQIPWSYKYVQKILAAYLQEQFQVKRKLATRVISLLKILSNQQIGIS